MLDVQVFNGRQKWLKPSLQTFFLWIFESFVVSFDTLYILGVKKHTLFNKFLSQKFLEAIREEKEWFFVCCILDTDYELNSMNEWIADFSIKGKSLHPTALISYLSSYTEYKKRVEKGNKSTAAKMLCYRGADVSKDCAGKVISTHIQLKCNNDPLSHCVFLNTVKPKFIVFITFWWRVVNLPLKQIFVSVFFPFKRSLAHGFQVF